MKTILFTGARSGLAKATIDKLRDKIIKSMRLYITKNN